MYWWKEVICAKLASQSGRKWKDESHNRSYPLLQRVKELRPPPPWSPQSPTPKWPELRTTLIHLILNKHPQCDRLGSVSEINTVIGLAKLLRY